jgi:ubiquitin-protein ligase
VKLKCGPRYPDAAPSLYFVNKIAMSGVDPNSGLVNYQVVTGKMWTRHTTMYEYLCKVREAMQGAAKTKQPNPEEMYPGN